MNHWEENRDGALMRRTTRDFEKSRKRRHGDINVREVIGSIHMQRKVRRVIAEPSTNVGVGDI